MKMETFRRNVGVAGVIGGSGAATGSDTGYQQVRGMRRCVRT